LLPYSVTKKSIPYVLQFFPLSATKVFIANSGRFFFWNFSVCSFLTVHLPPLLPRFLRLHATMGQV
jgi:hypothetical protein